MELPPLERVEAAVRFRPRPVEALEAPQVPQVEVEPKVAAPGEVVRLALREARSPGLLEVYQAGTLLWKRAFQGEERILFQVPWEAEGALRLRFVGEGWQKEVLLPVDKGRALLEVRLDPPRSALGQQVAVEVRVRFPAEGVEVALAGRERLPLSRVEGAGGELQTVYRGTLRLIPEVLAAAVPVSERWLGLGLVVAAWQGEHRVQGSARLLVDRRSP